MERVKKKKTELEDWIIWFEKSLWQGITWVNDEDKVELLNLLKELERRRADDSKENCKNFK